MREGGLETLMQVSFIIIIGSVVSNIVCFTLWPQTAITNLQSNMIRTLDSFTTLLSMLTNTFLLGDSSSLHQPSQGRLQRAIEDHQASFTSLKKNLAEAQSEWICGGPSVSTHGITINIARAYEDAVDSMNRLAQHLNGLRSGTRLQYELTKAHLEGKIILKNRSADELKRDIPSFSKKLGREVREAMKGKAIESEAEQSDEEAATLRAAAVMFGELVDDLGPPLNSLSVSMVHGIQ